MIVPTLIPTLPLSHTRSQTRDRTMMPNRIWFPLLAHLSQLPTPIRRTYTVLSLTLAAIRPELAHRKAK